MREKEEEYKTTMESLLARIETSEDEKDMLRKELSKQGMELENARREVRRRRRTPVRIIPDDNIDSFKDLVLSYSKGELLDRIKAVTGIRPQHPADLAFLFSSVKRELPKGYISDLEKLGWLDLEGDLTLNAAEEILGAVED